MTKKPVTPTKKLARYEPDTVYIGAGEYVAECVRDDDGDYYLAADVDAEIETLRSEVERLKSMTAVTMGVGSGDGNLFIHGDYESIKAAQAIVLERDALREEVDRLTCELMDAITRADKLAEALECMIIGACAVAVPHNGERAVLQDAVNIARAALAAYRKGAHQ